MNDNSISLTPLMTKIDSSIKSESTNLVGVNPNKTEIESNTYYNDILVLDNIPKYDIQDYDIFDDKDFKKYIMDIERIVRQSVEYRQFVNYLRENMNMNKCSFFENVSNSDTFKIRIELHHHPFTLYDIVLTIFNKRLFYKESLEVEMVAKEVMYVHYFLLVGIIPLSETVHELVHNQVLFVPLDRVMGNWEEFINMYGEWIPPETMEKIDELKTRTLAYNEVSNLSIIEQSPLILQLPEDTSDGTYNLPTLEVIEAAMNRRIQTIKDNHYQLPVEPQAELKQ